MKLEYWLIVGAVLIATEVIGVVYWNDYSEKQNEKQYQPYLDKLSCDDLKDIVLLSTNSTLVSQAQINAQKRCLP